MFRQLVSHNNDLGRLVEKGYAVGFDSQCLIVRDIPYLDNELRLCWGAIVTKLKYTDLDHVVPEDHQVFFAGSAPYGLDGNPLPNLGGGATQFPLTEAYADVVVERSFSHKPMAAGQFRDYKDFFEKIERYTNTICGPAIERFGASPFTYRVNESVAPDAIFKVHDTLTSRAEISELSAKFNQDVVAVIGLGGTGAYVLDFLVKTPVREIRAFDPDLFHVHNTFRSPGRLDTSTANNELNRPKADVYQARYENFRHGLTATCKFIDATCSDDLDGVTFAFVCVDKGRSRAEIFDLLLANNIPFIDVGMGLSSKHGALSGLLRTTYYSAEHGKEARKMSLAELSDDPENLYRTNIQIGELNALNACLAIIRYKQLRGFYLEENPAFHYLMRISDFKITRLSDTDEI